MRRPNWFRTEWFWDGLCALAEGSRSTLRRLLRLPARRRSDPKPMFRKCYPSVEPLEHRQTMSTVQFNASNFNVGESSSPGTATVNLDTSSGVTITVNYFTSNGTAGSGDYTSTGGMLTFAPGETSKTFNVTITGDSLDENDETINLTLSGVTGAGASLGSPSTATMTIQDDDAPPTLGLSSSTYSNGESATATITVNLSAASGKTITVDYATSNGTATAGSDYTSTSGTLTFNPGETSKTFFVSITTDSTDEDNETVAIGLTNISNAGSGTTSATLTINDDDSPPSISFSSSIGTTNEAAGQIPLTLNLSAASGKTITVQYSTTAGTATSNVDYTSIATTTLTFNPGETSKAIAVDLINDTTPETTDETFTLSLANLVNVSSGIYTTYTAYVRDSETTGISEFSFSSGSGPWDVVVGPDGNLWVTLFSSSKIAKVATDGTITEYALTASSGPRGITVGPDGNLWAALETSNQVAKITTSGSITYYNLTTSSSQPFDIVAGSDGNLWVTQPGANKVAKVTTSGTVTEYTLPTSSSNPRGIAAGVDGNLWVALQDVNKIAKITTGGTVTEYTVPTSSSQPYAIIAGNDGTLWFTEKFGGKLGQITTGGLFRELMSGLFNPVALTQTADGAFWGVDGTTNATSPLFRDSPQTGAITTYGNFTATQYRNIAVGSDNHLWITEFDTGRIARFALGATAVARTDDLRSGGQLVTITPQGEVNAANFLDPSAHPIVDPTTGALYVTAALDWRQQAGTGNALVYVSSMAAPKPIIEVTWAGDAQGAVPTGLDIRLNWNTGGYGSWVSYATTGHSAGDVYLLAIQTPSVVSTNGYYTYSVEVKATFSGGYTLTRSADGSMYVAIQGGMIGATSPALSAGWGLTGLNKLYTFGINDVAWVSATETRIFRSLGSGQYLSPSGDFGALVKTGSVWAYTSKDQVVTNFDNSGYQTSVVDPHGLYTTYTYSSNRLTGIQDPDGTRLTFAYDMSGRLATATMPGSRTVTFTSDMNGNMTALQNPDGGTRTFTYDSDHRMTSEVWDQRRTTFAYAGNGTVGTVTLDTSTAFALAPAAVTALGAATAKNASDAYGRLTDGLARTTDFTTDRLGRLTKLVQGDGGVATLTRDWAGQVTRFVDQLGNTTTNTYDYTTGGKGDLTTITLPDGNTKQFTYDSTYHKVTSAVNESGFTSLYTYNAYGDLATATTPDLQTTTYTWSAGLLQTVTSNLNLTTTFLYDATRRRETVIDTLGNRTTSGYDAAGNLTSVTPPVGAPTTFTYDGMRRVTSQRVDGYGTWTYSYNAQGQALTSTDNIGRLSTAVYDSAGRLSVSIDPLGRRTSYSYDAAGQVQTVIDPLGNRVTYAWDEVGRRKTVTDAQGTTTFVHDLAGQNTVVINALGLRGTSVFDSRGRIGTMIDTLGNRTTTLYHADGRVQAVVSADLTRTTYLYDAYGRLETTIGADGARATRVYDGYGRLQVSVDTSGGRTTFIFDSQGRQSGVIYPSGARSTVAFDAYGRVEYSIDQFGNRTTPVYDSYNRQEAVVDADGNRATSVLDAYGREEATIDVYGHRTTTVYDALGRVSAIVDVFGNRSTTTYTADGQVEAQVDPFGNRTTFVYDSQGRQYVTIDADGQRTTTLFDAAGRVETVIDRYGQRTTTLYDAAGRAYGTTTAFGTWSTQYDSVGRPEVSIDNLGLRTTTVYDAEGRVSAVVEPGGNRTTYLYDGQGRQYVTIDFLGNRGTTVYDAVGRVEATVDLFGNRSTTVYDAQGLVSAQVDYLGRRTTFVYDAQGRLSAQVDPFGNTTTFLYDSHGQQYVTIDPLGNRGTTVFDAYGRAEATIDSFGNRTTTVFAGNGQMAAQVDMLGNRTSFVYDSRGRLEATIDIFGNRGTTVFDSYGRAYATVDALGNRNTTVFDAYGRTEATVDQFGNRTSFVYDSYGRQYVTIDVLGNRTTTGFDALGRPETTTTALGVWTTVYDAYGRAAAQVDALGNRTTTVFSAQGLVEAVVDARGNRTTTVFDAQGRAYVTVDALGGRTTTVFNAQGQVEAVVNALNKRTTFVFDSYGRQIATVDALNNRTTTVFSAQGLVEAVVDARGGRTTTVFDAKGRAEATVDALGNRATSVFNSYGQVEATINALGLRATTVFDGYGRAVAQVDELGNRTTSVFDAHGNRTVVIDPLGNRTTSVFDAYGREEERVDALGESTTFAYDAQGRMSSTTDRLGRRRDIAYDALDRKTGETWVAADGTTVDARLTFTYDANGNQLTAVNGNGAYTMTYDALNRVATVAEPFGKGMTFSYDAVGNRTKVEDSLGGVTTSTFDDIQQLTKREFDDGTNQVRIDLTYNEVGQTASEIRYSDLAGTSLVARTSFTYDATGQLTSQHHRNSAGATIANYTYVYDNHGRLTSATDHGVTTTYAYDNTDQLTGDGTTTVTYDANGNRNNGSYDVDPGNQISTDGTWNYYYDLEGNQNKQIKIVGGETWTYGYNQRNEMTWVEKRATDGGTLQQRVDFKYDVYGNILEKQVDSDGDASVDSTLRYAYDAWNPAGGQPVGNEKFNVWAHLDGSSSLTTRYIRGDAVDELFARIETPNTSFFYLNDRQGSARDIVSAAGTVVDAITYGGFGNIATETDSSKRGLFAYTAREYHQDIDRQNNHARWYNATLGRWMSQDPIGFAAGDSNLYRYVRNENTLLTDPSGLQAPGESVGGAKYSLPSPSPGSNPIALVPGYGVLAGNAGYYPSPVPIPASQKTFTPTFTADPSSAIALAHVRKVTVAVQKANPSARFTADDLSSAYLAMKVGPTGKSMAGFKAQLKGSELTYFSVLEEFVDLQQNRVYSAAGEKALSAAWQKLQTAERALTQAYESSFNYIETEVYVDDFGYNPLSIVAKNPELKVNNKLTATPEQDRAYLATREKFLDQKQKDLEEWTRRGSAGPEAVAGEPGFREFLGFLEGAVMFIPVVGPLYDAVKSFVGGDFKGGVLAIGMAGLDVAMFGAGRVSRMGKGAPAKAGLEAGEFLGRGGRATAVPLHNPNTPWYQFLNPRYEAVVKFRGPLSRAERVQVILHEGQHAVDFLAHPQITYLATQGSVPGSGFARYFLEFRAYRSGGVTGLQSLTAPFRSFKTAQNIQFGRDVVIFVGGTGGAVYLNLSD